MIRIRIGLAPWIRIRIEIKSWIRIRTETNADPKQWIYESPPIKAMNRQSNHYLLLEMLSFSLFLEFSLRVQVPDFIISTINNVKKYRTGSLRSHPVP
jgi:hypothetical protein